MLNESQAQLNDNLGFQHYRTNKVLGINAILLCKENCVMLQYISAVHPVLEGTHYHQYPFTNLQLFCKYDGCSLVCWYPCCLIDAELITIKIIFWNLID